MRILLTNDDGIGALGLRALHHAFTQAGHTVITVAPQTQQSGVSSAVTLHAPLRVYPVHDRAFEGFAVSGTPVDCVKIALTSLLEEHGGPPDLVVSGMNAGRNAGVDVLYSGTVAAAVEAAVQGLPSLSVSHDQYSPTTLEALMPYAEHAVALVGRFDWQILPVRRVMNLNYPNRPVNEAKGLRLCRTATTPWADSYHERRDPAGHPYWWISGYVPSTGLVDDEDCSLLNDGWITFSPLAIDMTDSVFLRALQEELALTESGAGTH